jgi:hypothetical protein
VRLKTRMDFAEILSKFYFTKSTTPGTYRILGSWGHYYSTIISRCILVDKIYRLVISVPEGTSRHTNSSVAFTSPMIKYAT